MIENIFIESSPLENNRKFLSGLYLSLRALRQPVQQLNSISYSFPNSLHIVWNSPEFLGKKNFIFCENGWLPRTDFQISPLGFNARHRYAGWEWDGSDISPSLNNIVESRVNELRNTPSPIHFYYNPTLPPIDFIDFEFLLCPLQMEWDSNLRFFCPVDLRTNQLFIDFVSSSNPPLPCLYKQHPVDSLQTNQHPKLLLRRSQDKIIEHSLGNIHQYLKSPLCRGVISVNSGTLYDCLLWDKPAVALGQGMWPRSGNEVFYTHLPSHWPTFLIQFQNPVHALPVPYF